MADTNDGGPVRAQGYRKSQFPALQSVDPNAYVDFWTQGVNYKITWADFLNALEVTGTIVQSGNVLGVPVLDKQGAVNNIRNLEVSVGLTAAVSPENGIDLRSAFLPAAGGAQVLINEATAPQIRSLVAGTGITIGSSGDQIQISVTGGPPTSTKTIIVDTINDFPPAVGGVITLLPDTEYFLVNDITTADRFVFSNNCAIKAGDALTIMLTYTGTGAMFTSAVASARVTEISLSAPSGTLFDLSAGGSFDLIELRIISCDTIAQIDAFGSMFITSCAFRSVTGKGFVFSGTNVLFLMNNSSILQSAGTTFELGTSTFNTWMISNCVIESFGPITVLSGAAASGNVNAGRVATVANTRIGGVGPITPLAGITPDDDRWEFSLNDLIRDTRRTALNALINNAVNTVITTIGVPVLLAGTWTPGKVSGYTASTAGRMTYNSPKGIDAGVLATMVAAKIGGATANYRFEFAVNGAVISNSGKTVTLDANGGSITMTWSVLLSPTDFVEIFVTNLSGTSDILVSDVQFTVR